jgi:putative NADH-flavin reductase
MKARDVTTTVAVIGATGTAGSRVVARLKGRGVAVLI